MSCKGFQNIMNEENKIRISLSRRAYTIMLSDMNTFELSVPATFINRLIQNFSEDACSSISRFLFHKKQDYEASFETSGLDPQVCSRVIEHLLSEEEKKLKDRIRDYLKIREVSKIYHINNENLNFLKNDIDEKDVDFYDNRAGSYIKALLEEYSRLQFIQRERIMKKEIYHIIETACELHETLQIKSGNPEKVFTVYPYKIIPDPLNIQDYLVCYTKSDHSSEKKEASFSMLRIAKPKIYRQRFSLSKKEIANLEFAISQKSAAFLLGNTEKIIVRLTDTGKQWYQRRLNNRPESYVYDSTTDEYLFSCPEWQALMYFLPFGDNAEVLSPVSLRNQFRDIYEKACIKYAATQAGKPNRR